MPDVRIVFEQVHGKTSRRTELKTMEVPREFWDIQAIERTLEADGWFRHDPNRGYDPISELAHSIAGACEDFDGMDLDIRIELRSVPEEQRSGDGR
jgi:hypothetical protein